MIYLDNAATTRVFDSVVKEMERYYSEEYFNPSALYSPAFEVVKKIAAARAYLCDKLGRKVVFYIVRNRVQRMGL